MLPNHADGFDGSRILAGGPLIRARSSVRERVVRFSAIRTITTKVLLGSHERRCEGGNEVSRGMGAAKGGGPPLKHFNLRGFCQLQSVARARYHLSVNRVLEFRSEVYGLTILIDTDSSPQRAPPARAGRYLSTASSRWPLRMVPRPPLPARPQARQYYLSRLRSTGIPAASISRASSHFQPGSSSLLYSTPE